MQLFAASREAQREERDPRSLSLPPRFMGRKAEMRGSGTKSLYHQSCKQLHCEHLSGDPL